VEKAMHHKVFENEEIRNIFTALGVTVGTAEDSKALNMEKLRYHKVIIMCDADVDGSHISTNNILFRFMKLIEEGHVYIAAPPLYLVKIRKNMHGMTLNVMRLMKEWAVAHLFSVIKVLGK
jgi:DNA gyrase subunit B